jgi:hemerythrin
MQEVEWTDDLSVGIQLIDDQHKMLIERLNNLATAVEQHHGPEKIATTLQFLIDYTDFHFSAEEHHMAAQQYPGLDLQKTRHTEFKDTLSNLEADFREEGATHELAESIDTLLGNWLLKHIRTVDVEFGQFVKVKGVVLTEEG